MSIVNNQNKNMQQVIQPIIGFLALSTLCGICLHDTNLDKVTVHLVAHHNQIDGASTSISSHAHTHSERNPLGGKSQASLARDPRDDKTRHQNQSQRDYFRLPGQADMTDHTIVLA